MPDPDTAYPAPLPPAMDRTSGTMDICDVGVGRLPGRGAYSGGVSHNRSIRVPRRGPMTARASEIPLAITGKVDTYFFVMTNVVTFCRALSDDTRWRIVRLVMDRALCVCELADILGMPQSSVSSHVQVIRKAGLLESETCGKWTYFRIVRGHVAVVRSLMRHFSDSGGHAGDLERAELRLARRDSSCCPGPVKLAKSRTTKPS